MNENKATTSALEAAQAVLESRVRRSISFGRVERLDSPHTVLRAVVHGGEGLPESIVIKQLPPEARFGARKRAMSEWAGLEFSGAIAGAVEFAPRFLGGDADKLLIILEDLGDAPSLDHILRHGDRAAARQTLLDYGDFLGEFHGAAAGRELVFMSIQQRLKAETPPNDSSIDIRDRLAQFRAAFSPLNVRLDAVQDEITAASAAMHDAHPYRTFQHHDAGPHNILVTEKGLRLVDFEFAQFDNALLDMTAVRLAFPPFGKGRLLPAEAIEGFENSYRQAVSRAIPEMAEDEFYQLTVEQACVQWIVSKTAGLGESLYPVLVRNDLGENPDPGRIERVKEHRNLCFMWITAYLHWFGNRARLPHTRDAIRRLADEIQEWNPLVEDAGMYGAFAS